DINNATAGNNAGSVDMSTQTSTPASPASHMSQKARSNAHAAQEETTRQLNRQQARLNEQSTAGGAVKMTPSAQ
ncbi:MAG TPA: hypothetical protein VH189_08255, partial [Rhizomicrobium sp.]|nr:hypothetical protein [Rhizomicrobium sp.]